MMRRRAVVVLLFAVWLSGCATVRMHRPSLAVVTGALVGWVAWHVYSHTDGDGE